MSGRVVGRPEEITQLYPEMRSPEIAGEVAVAISLEDSLAWVADHPGYEVSFADLLVGTLAKVGSDAGSLRAFGYTDRQIAAWVRAEIKVAIRECEDICKERGRVHDR